MTEEKGFCCDKFVNSINYDEYYIVINEDNSKYWLKTFSTCRVPEGGGHEFNMIEIYFCPYCGTKLENFT